MSYLPSNFTAKFTELQNYSKSPLRIIPSSGQGKIRSNGFIKFSLPIAVLDMRTFSIFFDAKTLIGGIDPLVGQLVGFPKFIGQSLIETLDIFVNGRNVQNIPQYGRVYALLQNYKNNYNSQIKKLQTNSDPSIYTSMAETGLVTSYNTYTVTSSLDANAGKGKYVINDWIGFLECQPSILDLNVIGNVEIHIKLASANVLFASGLTGAGTANLFTESLDYELENVVAYVDQIHMRSDRYTETVKGMMESKEAFPILYKNYMVYTGSEMSTTKKNTIKITENTACLNKVIFSCWDNTIPTGKAVLQLGDSTKILGTGVLVGAATYNQGDIAAISGRLANVSAGHVPPSQFNFTNLLANGEDKLLNNSLYFKQNGLGIGTVQLELNSQDVTNPLSLVEQWQQTLQTFELNDNDVLQINPAIRNINVYERDFYCCAFSTEHINNRDDDLGVLLSGRDTMASAMNITVKCEPGRTWHISQAATPVIITEMTSKLLVSGQRQILCVR